jgi:hypothetical protein
VILSSGFNERNKISPNTLQIKEITEIVAKPNIPNKIKKIGALRLADKNIIPLMCPRFSTRVWSAKKAKHEGIPNPNENPKEKRIIKV